MPFPVTQQEGFNYLLSFSTASPVKQCLPCLYSLSVLLLWAERTQTWTTALYQTSCNRLRNLRTCTDPPETKECPQD